MTTTTTTLGSELEPLPPLYQRWLDDLLGAGVPRESAATCSSCAMCSGSAPAGDDAHFHPSVKCCSFLPSLPNYLVGRILLDEEAVAGRASTLSRIGARIAVTPLGIGRPRSYSALNREGGPESFGRSLALRCPHYQAEAGTCGIWRHREAVCATWFCKHVRGSVGLAFWHGALRPLLASVEIALARWCVLELDVGERALELLMAAPTQDRAGREIDGVFDEGGYRAIWGSYRDREEELFIACAGHVAPLSWKDVLAIGGSEVRARAAITQGAYRRLLSTGLPARARTAALRVVKGDRERVTLLTYSTTDPIDVPRTLLEALPRFDGGAIAEAVSALAGDGIEIDEEMTRYLLDFGVLEEPPA